MLQDDAMKIAGARLRELRERKGLSQEDASFEAGVEQSTLSKIERLGPHIASWGKIFKLAAALDCVVEVTFSPKK